jgi:hypothetical protein
MSLELLHDLKIQLYRWQQLKLRHLLKLMFSPFIPLQLLPFIVPKLVLKLKLELDFEQEVHIELIVVYLLAQ